MCTRNWSLPYDQRLSFLNLPTLSFRRKIIKICFLYKMLNGLSAPPFPLTTINHSYNTCSHDLSLCTSYAHNNPFLHSFLNSTIRLWNNLPSDIVTAGVFSQEQFSATSLFKLIFTLVSLPIIKIPSLGNIELVKLFYTVWLCTMGTQGRQV